MGYSICNNIERKKFLSTSETNHGCVDEIGPIEEQENKSKDINSRVRQN